MSTSRRAFLFAALCMSLLGLSLQAAKPNDDNQRYKAGLKQTPAEIGGKTYDQWKNDLLHRDPSVRATAIMVMPLFGERSMDAVPKLASIATGDGDASPRVKAVLALNMMYIRQDDVDIVVKSLGRCVAHDPQTIIRYEAAKALQRFGPAAQKIIPDLVIGMGNISTFEVREVCIIALRAAGVDPGKGPDPRVTDELIRRLNPFTEPAKEVRLQAIMALGGMGRPHDPNKLRQVMDALKSSNTSNSKDKVIRLWSHVALMALEDKVNESYLKTVVDYMRDRERDVRKHAVTAMGALGVKAHEYLREVIALLDDKEFDVRYATCQALGRMGDRGERVLQALIRMTEYNKGPSDEVVPMVLAACQGLANIGVTSPEVMSALNRVLERPDLKEPQKKIVRDAIEEIKKPKDDLKAKGKENPKKGPPKK